MSNNQKPLQDMLIDALIIGAIALFSVVGELSSIDFWLVGLKSFAIAFCVQLAIERGIKPKISTNQ